MFYGSRSIVKQNAANRWRRLRLGIIGVALSLGLAAAVVWAIPVEVPWTRGDQLIFYFDMTAGHITYLGVSNPAKDEVHVEIVAYGGDLANTADKLLAKQVVKIAGGSNHVFDLTTSLGSNLANHAGLIVVTPVLADDDQTPIVPQQPLAGMFTIADTNSKNGYGENPMGRFALTAADKNPAPGTVVDGTTVSYEKFAPLVLMVPSFFNPTGDSDDQVVLVTFDDVYPTASQKAFRIGPHTPNAKLSVQICTSSQGAIPTPVPTSLPSIFSTKVETLAGNTKLASSGNAYLTVSPGEGTGATAPQNFFGLFHQALGNYAAGQRLPAADAVPSCTPSPTATMMPGTPTPIPHCGNGKREGTEQCDGDDTYACIDLIGGKPDSGDVCHGTKPSCNADCTADVSSCKCDCARDSNCVFKIDCDEVVAGCTTHACVIDPADGIKRCPSEQPVGQTLMDICKGRNDATHELRCPEE